MRKEPTSEGKLAWRLILAIILFVGMEVLLRAIPIVLITASMVSTGVTRDTAAARARAIVFEDPLWSTVIGVLVGAMGFLIVWFLVRGVEKSRLTWRALGLDWRRSSLPMILAGTLLALILFAAYVITARLTGSSETSVLALLVGATTGIFLRNLILTVAMGYGEEVMFRAYIQTRLSARLGVIWGVVGTALLFTLLHQLSYELSPVVILSGILLWTTLGALYHLTQSLYLVGTFHGVMNAMLTTLNTDVGGVDGLIVHALALVALVVVARSRSKPAGDRPKPTQRT